MPYPFHKLMRLNHMDAKPGVRERSYWTILSISTPR